MTVFDLTHPIAQNMPVYPGTEPPTITTECSIDEVGFLEKKITMYSHTGTHVDAPTHLLKNHNTLDMLKIDHFYGSAFLLHHDDSTVKSIGVNLLQPYQDKIQAVDFLLLHTGWSQYWGFKQYFADYPVLSLEAAHWLGRFGLKGFGLDTISADPVDSQDYPVHKALLQNNIIIIENLANLQDLPCNHFDFSCFPLSMADAEGSPVRAVAFIQ